MPRLKHNIPAAIRKLEADIKAVNSAIGIGTADFINVAFKHAHDKGFLKGQKRRYSEVPGGNIFITRKFRGRVITIPVAHRTKVVDRGGGLPDVYNKPRWNKSLSGNTIASFNQTGINGKIYKAKGLIQADLMLEGRKGNILAILEKGSANHHFRRRIFRQALKTTSSRWKKLAEFRLTGTLAKRNKVKIKSTGVF